MFINLDRPLVVFDLETTGLFPKRDRIIELGAIKVMPDGSEEERCWLLNPGIPIPPESTAVHGIADEDVKDCPTFADSADDTERIPVGDTKAYDSKAEAEKAALKQLPDITLATASKVAAEKIDTYTGMFEIRTVQNADTGKWENKPAMKASVEAELREDMTEALSTVATTGSLTELGTGITGITLSNPKPGLYYVMEFSESLGGGVGVEVRGAALCESRLRGKTANPATAAKRESSAADRGRGATGGGWRGW